MAPVTRLRPQATLREQLLGWEGVHAEEGDARRVVVAGRHYLLTPLASVGHSRLILCEWPRSPRLPGYQARQRLHAQNGEGAITIFTDAAGTRQVWGWARPMAFATPLYTEEYTDGDGPPACLAEAARPSEGELTVDDPAAAAEGAEQVRELLIGRLRRDRGVAVLLRRGAGVQLSIRLQRLVARARRPEVPRRVWREMVGLRVLDPACGTGSWLAGCLCALTAVGAACLQWMQAWVEDSSPGRADRDGDFRRLLTRARELSAEGGRDRLVVETVLLRCLCGLEADRSAAARAQVVLASRLARSARALGEELAARPAGAADAHLDEAAFADVRRGRLAGEETGLSGLRRSDVTVSGLHAAAATLAAEAESLGRAWEQIIRARLQARAPLGDVREGRDEVRRRRAALTAWLGGAGGSLEGAAELHPFIEFHDVLRAGGFHLVRRSAVASIVGGGSAAA